MNIAELKDAIDSETLGLEMYDMISRLHPICRSITGDGVRETLAVVDERAPLNVHEVPTGTPVFDWVVPKEWNIRDAYIKGPNGDKVVDFQRSNLHVVGYSLPIDERMSLESLKPHLHSDPAHPQWIPNRTSYYKEGWGFCLSHHDLERLEEGEYEVRIDSTLEDGSLTYGECFLPGVVAEEVLFSTHVCHPSLCNDNLSGIAVATFLAQILAGRPLHYSYRFLFIPTTIGSITWLARNEEAASRVRHGLVLTCLGDDGGFSYKRSRRGAAVIDRACLHVLNRKGRPPTVFDFSPNGGDERQFCSPGFNLPVGVLMRTAFGSFPQYHTSADDLDFVRPGALAESLVTLLDVVSILETDRRYLSNNPYGEPHLGRRGVWLSGDWPFGPSNQQPLLWVLNMADGEHSLLDVAERSGLDFDSLRQAAEALLKHDLIAERGRRTSA